MPRRAGAGILLPITWMSELHFRIHFIFLSTQDELDIRPYQKQHVSALSWLG